MKFDRKETCSYTDNTSLNDLGFVFKIHQYLSILLLLVLFAMLLWSVAVAVLNRYLL